MAERRINMNNKVENFEWHSLLDLSGKGLHKFNAVGKDMTCSQLMNNAGLDWNVEMKEVYFNDNKGRYIDNYNGDKKLYSLVKDDKQILVSNLTESYKPLQNSKIAQLGDYFANKTGIKFEHAFSYDNDKYLTFMAKTNGSFNIGDDVVNAYVLFNNFHTGRDKSSVLTTNINIFCSNTYLNALKDRDQFKIAISHRIEMSDAFYLYLQNKIDEALKSNSEYKEKALTLDNKQITEKDLMNYLVFVYNPKLLQEFSKGKQNYEEFEKLDGNNTQIKRAYGVWHDTIESNGKMYKLQNTGNQARKDTLWKAFNCVTYNEDHLRGGENNVSSRLKNNLINNGKDNIKDRAMTRALELAS